MESKIGFYIEQLFSKDNNAAYQALRTLTAFSAESDAVYAYFDRFARMLRDDSSYIRTRGMLLIAANVRWDDENKIESALEDYLGRVLDEKPITARQCIQSLPEIARCKPRFAGRIIEALKNADVSGYADTMRPLLVKDIANALKTIEKDAAARL
jgi:hypothetical protein